MTGTFTAFPTYIPDSGGGGGTAQKVIHVKNRSIYLFKLYYKDSKNYL